jgi:hypothetical protein
MLRFALLAALALCLSAEAATAGPLLDRLRARVAARRCTAPQARPAVAFPPAAAPAYPAAVTACPGGVCYAPAAPAVAFPPACGPGGCPAPARR